VALLALIAGQDVEPIEGSDGADGHWRIAERVALSAPNSALATRWTQGGRQNADSARPGKPLDAEYPVDIVRHRHVLVGDATLGMRHERECHCPPTDIDIGMMILGFGVLSRRPWTARSRRARRLRPRNALE
jgi:hypothetical protein